MVFISKAVIMFNVVMVLKGNFWSLPCHMKSTLSLTMTLVDALLADIF